MKILDGQVALGNKSGTKAMGEHKVGFTVLRLSQMLKKAQFWKTQPVPQLPSADTLELQEGPIDPPRTPAEVKRESGALPSGFDWSLIDIKKDAQVSHISNLLYGVEQAAGGASYPAVRKLCGGRRCDVPLQLPSRVPLMVSRPLQRAS